MTSKITATFLRRRLQDSGKDQAPDYYVYEFTDIVDEKGKEYEITLSSTPYSSTSIRLPFPIEIAWDNQRVYLKGGNSITQATKDGQETNLSVPLNKATGVSRYETAAFNKFQRGLMTEELLLKMNAKGIFYQVHYYDPQDKRKFGGCSVGYTKEDKQNQVLIQKETQAEIDRDLETIRRCYVTKEIQKHFVFRTEILQSKKRKK